MKNAFIRISAIILILCSILSLFTACDSGPVDYVSETKLDMSSDSLKAEVTVKAFIDGDTTHFYVSESVSETGILKARYLGINTPESTGKIEEWGKKASNFTKEKLSSASSIYIESDDGKWNLDSTGDRHLVWVWYLPKGETEYRNLNIELLQNGLAIASNSGGNRYGETCLAAIAQAEEQLLHVYSEERDPDFYYGSAIPLDLRELRCNISDYSGLKVSFEGVITKNESNSVYVESYDAETDLYYGMYVYYGFALSGDGLEILSLGNRVRIVGTVQYYETGDSWQVSGLQYRVMKPNDPNNIQKLDDEYHDPAYKLIDANTYKNGEITVNFEEGSKTFAFANLSLYSSVEMRGLVVRDVYTTRSETSSDKGAMTLYCEVDGIEISVRTVVLYDENGDLVTADTFEGKTIDVKGVIDYYNFDGEEEFPYQIKLFSMEDVTIH